MRNMIKLLLFFLLLGLVHPIMGQMQLLFEDSFDDNTLGWRTDSTPIAQSRIADGMYQLKAGPDLPGFRAYFRPFYFNSRSAYQIEAQLHFTNKGQGCGLVWGARSSRTMIALTFHPEGIIVRQILKGKSRTLARTKLSWTSEDVEVLVRRIGQKIKILIDGTETLDFPAPDASGKGMGFILTKDAQMEAKSLKVSHASPIDLLPNMPAGIRKENLGPNVNSAFNEYAPVISPDGETLYYVVRESRVEDIYLTQRTDSGWTPRKKLPFPLNLPTHSNSVISVSADNNSLVVINTYKADGSYRGTGLSVSQRQVEGWEIPKALIIDDYYNLSRRQDQYISANRKIMIHSLQRREGLGGRDLFVSFLQKDGTWSTPKNLGSSINSEGNDVTPCLAPDGKTLYFSNETRVGYGSFDVYVSRRLDDTWTNWSPPKNLGSDINTRGSDAFYVVPASGRFGYIASPSPSGKDRDIYRFKLPEAAKPEPVVLVYGKVLNKETNEPVRTEIAFYDLDSQVEEGIASSAPKTGDYKVVLPGGKQFNLIATKKGFLSLSDYVDVRSQNVYEEIRKDLYLTPIKAGASINLSNLYFDFAKADLREASIPELDQLIIAMEQKASITIRLTGHTDNVGSDPKNLSLSKERAQAVKDYIMSKGIGADRIETTGKGESQPIADNNTDAGRQKNRRVELTIVKD
ncbi:MAG: OmpA family protein [Bacteroidota bacterium]